MLSQPALGALAASFAMVLAMPGTASARLLELTFDDGPDGSGPAEGLAELANMEARQAQLGVGELTAVLTGTAHRSALTEGRYGRAADFDGGGGIEVTGLTDVTNPVETVYMWILVRGDGTILELEGSFALVVQAGALAVEVDDGAGGTTSVPLGATIPMDGALHHLAVTVDRSAAPVAFTASVDFTPGSPVAVPGVGAPVADPRLWFGTGFDGLIDELLLTETAPNNPDFMDFDPSYCGAGYECLEEVLTLVPTDFPHEVPVRFKALWNPAICSDTAPCPLAFDISGGNECADDYQSPASLHDLADEGFFVVTVDLYCEVGPRVRAFPMETSQLIAVKDHLLGASTLAPRITGTEYVATGCSHGAGTVASWAVHETDRPSRTYARSPTIDILCALASGILCPTVEAAHPVDDWNAPEVEASFNGSVTPEDIDAELVANIDIAISFGVNLDGPICTATGDFACNEESLWGMHYGAQRFRDVWQSLEGDTPTGYFVEDRGADCRHCAAVGSDAFRCGICLLRNGRDGMAAGCPECLDYSAADIGPGGEAEACLIDAAWYEDPLASLPPPPPPNPKDPGGCGCHVGADAAPGAGAMSALLLLVLGVTRRQRR